MQSTDRCKDFWESFGEEVDKFLFRVVHRGDGRFRYMEADGLLQNCSKELAESVEGAVKPAALLRVKQERMEVNGTAGLGELEAVPVVLEAEAFLDNDAEPSFGALHEKLVEDGWVHEENAVHGSLNETRKANG